MTTSSSRRMSPEMKVLVSRIVPLVFAVIGTLFLLSGVRGLIRSRASLRWPTVQGKVIASSVERTHDTGETYHAHVQYEFAVEGTTYNGDRVAYGDFHHGDPTQPTSCSPALSKREDRIRALHAWKAGRVPAGARSESATLVLSGCRIGLLHSRHSDGRAAAKGKVETLAAVSAQSIRDMRMKSARFFLIVAVVLGFAGIKCLNSGATPTFGAEEVHKIGIFCSTLSTVMLILGVAIVVAISRRRD